jgi:DNA ligase D-like protein (predicted 3'-phosphoesterase)
MAAPHRLAAYRRTRRFACTPEPRGRRGRRTARRPRFVIQKHAARTLHYDVRLEIGGVLKSWAVPKEPSRDPRVKRLAVPTEDHPLEYARFEGVIPTGEYGAGRIRIWDRGTYRNITERGGKAVPAESAHARGHLAVWLNGKRLRGGFALTRIGTGRKPRWLLVKMHDEYAR